MHTILQKVEHNWCNSKIHWNIWRASKQGQVLVYLFGCTSLDIMGMTHFYKASACSSWCEIHACKLLTSKRYPLFLRMRIIHNIMQKLEITQIFSKLIRTSAFYLTKFTKAYCTGLWHRFLWIIDFFRTLIEIFFCANSCNQELIKWRFYLI